MKKNIYIIGTGKVGSAFAIELKEKGYGIRYITDRNKINLKNLTDIIKPEDYSDKIEKKFIIDSKIILICVQDRFLSNVISEIEKFNCQLSDKIFIHTSGAESTDVFNFESFDKLNTASMHPVQTFDKISIKNNHLLEKIYFGIEGGNAGKETAIGMIKDLNSSYIEIPKEKKYLYHSACVISSNFLITLLNISSEIMGSMGIDKSKTFEIFRPIIDNTLKNISEDGLINSLTGPFERNDIETISNHLNSINKELPSLIPFYTLLGMETVKVAFKKESLNLKNVISILDLMNEYIINESNSVSKTIN